MTYDCPGWIIEAMNAISHKLRPTKEELAELYADGWTNERIARRFTVSVNTVKGWRRDLGLPTMRPRYKDVIPWRVKMLPKGRKPYPLRMLQLLGRRRNGGPLKPREEIELDHFLHRLKSGGDCKMHPGEPHVVKYAPWREIEPFIIEPGEWIDGEIPIQLEPVPKPEPGIGGWHKRWETMER